MRRDTLALYASLPYAAIAVILAYLPMIPGIVRLPCILPLIILVPGHLLMRALDVATDRDPIDHVLFAIGTSIALAVLTGLALNWTPWGLSGPTQALALGLLSLVSGAVALWRHPTPVAVPRLSPWWQMGLTLALAGSMCAGALAIARAGALAQPQSGFTQAWLAPVANQTNIVQIGITNQEHASHTYRVVLYDHKHVTTTWSHITLANRQTWQLTFSVVPGAQLAADVYIDTVPTTRYRHVSFTNPR